MAKKIKSVTYGLGGYDESKPDNNVVAVDYYTDAEMTDLEAEEQRAAEKAAEETTRLLAKLAIYAKLGLTEKEINTLIS